MDKLCECCVEYKLQWELVNAYNQTTYRVCTICLGDLVNRNLTKKQFFALLGAGHSANEHLLHGDFYDAETWKALQPR